MAKTVFISYSHCDERLKDQLDKHLKPLEYDELIRPWHDRRIVAGDEFDTEIRSELESADIILLLVSSDFMSSEYCWGIEMKRAIERHEAREARVIPIILRPTDWQRSPFAKFEVLPKDGIAVTSWANLDEAFVDIAKSLRDAVSDGQNTTEKDSFRISEPEASSVNSLRDKPLGEAIVELRYHVPAPLNHMPGLSLNVLVDGTSVAVVYPDQTIRFDLSSGNHTIELRRLWHKSNALHLSAFPNESIQLTCQSLMFDSSSPLMARALSINTRAESFVLKRE